MASDFLIAKQMKIKPMIQTNSNGRKEAYNSLLLAAPWRNKRTEIMQRDGNRCVNCGSQEELNVHHRQYHINKINQEYKKPWEYDNKFLITLCRKCHEAGHKLYKVPVFNY